MHPQWPEKQKTKTKYHRFTAPDVPEVEEIGDNSSLAFRVQSEQDFYEDMESGKLKLITTPRTKSNIKILGVDVTKARVTNFLTPVPCRPDLIYTPLH